VVAPCEAVTRIEGAHAGQTAVCPPAGAGQDLGVMHVELPGLRHDRPRLAF